MANEFLPFIEQTAREAGALLLRYFHERVEIEYKGDVDLVTVADREAEKLIVGRIRAQFPKHDIVGEEGTRQETGSAFRWYVDPLDGTTNFAHGFPVFCASSSIPKLESASHGELCSPSKPGRGHDREDLYDHLDRHR